MFWSPTIWAKIKFISWKNLLIKKTSQNELFVVSFSNVVIFRLKLKSIKKIIKKYLLLVLIYLPIQIFIFSWGLIFLLLLKVWVIDKLCTYVSFDKVTVVINVVTQWCKTIIYSRAQQPYILSWFCSSWKNTLFIK